MKWPLSKLYFDSAHFSGLLHNRAAACRVFRVDDIPSLLKCDMDTEHEYIFRRPTLMKGGFISWIAVLLFHFVASNNLFAGELLKNRGFESGGNGDWQYYNVESGVATSAGIINNSNVARSPSSWYGYLGDVNTTTFHARGILRQVVTLPANVSKVTLKFYLNITSAQTLIRTAGENRFDTLTAELATFPDDIRISPILGEWSNLSRDPDGVRNNYTFINGLNAVDVSAYAGQQIMIKFYAQTDDSQFTTFRIDDVSLFAETVEQFPDLTPYKPGNWNDTIPIGITQLNSTDAHNFSDTYYDNQTLYFNWSSLNRGDAAAGSYTVRAQVTGTGGDSWEWSIPNHAVGQWYWLDLDQSVGPLSAGIHTFKVWVDYDDDVDEGSKEGNNYYERTITVQSPPETISTPGTITGEANPIQNVEYSYSIDPSTSSLGDTVEYSFDWGDGAASSFSTSRTASHTWSSTGLKSIVVTARCRTHTSVSNNNSPGKSVTVTPQVPLPNEGFTVTAGNYTPQPGQLVKFTAQITHQPEYEYFWQTSPDGQTATTRSATFAFSGSGRHNVSLRVKVGSRVSDSKPVEIYVQSNVSGTGGGGSSGNSQPTLGADPVNLASGSYTYEHTDLRFPGIGIPFEFRRFYNSKFNDQSGLPLGYGWSYSPSIHVTNDTVNAVVTFGDGHTESFTKSGDNYIGSAGVFDLLVKNPDNSWLVITKQQTTNYIDTAGRLVKLLQFGGERMG